LPRNISYFSIKELSTSHNPMNQFIHDQPIHSYLTLEVESPT
jgi:hypothetical protein